MLPRPSTPHNPCLQSPGTPRWCKVPSTLTKSVNGIKMCLPARVATPGDVHTTLKLDLDLNFEPDTWQAHLIHRILQGYNSVCVAATGLGKSLIFEGTAKLAGPNQAVIVICPLKALERDQVRHASAKGLDAIVVNEDTPKSPKLWESICRTKKLIYVSPEMALLDGFRNQVWKNPRFWSRLAAIFVDEAHVINEWGEEEFRPEY
ncbi:P-loop containing nucleoside triphosphate hydrolase protein [Gymnopus androsaceus JB14]|uniref:P-loop containing nucleoside triphosphate hydrolase protein n=1 Tax=Gymnopus androsaceus JB14 TaxID=1447944 RepID=A0A6A4IHG9_9AGAR|nr:P-loop containing nucleoside triphosphate hydrolase protein [Gymnopus androsaceus JB14]